MEEQVSQKQPHTAQGYEFGHAQNETFRNLGSRMKVVGIIYMVTGGFLGLIGVISLFVMPAFGVLYMLFATVQLLIGIWTNNAASSFRLIVDTKGSDISHLMSALESLRKLYNLQFWLLIVSLTLMVLAFIIGLAVGLGTFISMTQPTA